MVTLKEEILPYLKKYKGKTFVVKYGGSIMKNEVAQEAFFNDVSLMRANGINIIIVHGGGPEISKWLNKTGLESKFVNGLRVTDKNTMEIVEMVLSGNVNKKISSCLCRKGINAIGISGKDCNLIRAKKKYAYVNYQKIDIGYVGEVVSINKKLLIDLMEKEDVPVISPIGADNEGNTYNINADFAAAFISGVLKAEKLLIMTDIEGVYMNINDPSSLIPKITVSEIMDLISNGSITNGMIPKLECCVDAIEKGAKNVHLIDGRREHALLNDLCTSCGTSIISGGGLIKCQKII